jgi:hypothetical protein
VPLHDFTSHCADAFRYLCIGLGRHLIDRQPLTDPALSAGVRSAVNRLRFAGGHRGGQGNDKGPYGW